MLNSPVIAVDPGKGATGIAVFGPRGDLAQRGRLVYADLYKFEPWGAGPMDIDADLFGGQPPVVVIESQRIYPPRSGRPNISPASIVTLAQQAGGWAARIAAWLRPVTNYHVVFVLPTEWKGHVPKKAHQPRVLRELLVKEKDYFDHLDIAPSKLHNVVDAIGIGLWATKNITDKGATK